MGHSAIIGGAPQKAVDARLVLLGRACAGEIGGRKVKVPRLGLVLAAFLLLECPAMRATREAAARFLWEDADKNRQAGNLRQLLLRLRAIEAASGLQMFKLEENEIVLRHDGVEIDLCVFRASMPANSESGIAAICKAYRGDLLAGLNAGGEQLGAWLASKRRLLRTEFFDAILPCLEGQGKSPASNVTILAARRVVEIEPLQEIGCRFLMRAYAERGDREQARQVYLRLERLLARLHGREPSPSTRELRETLLVEARPPARVVVQPPLSEPPKTTLSNRGVAAAARTERPRRAVLARAPLPSSPAERELIEDLVDELNTRLAQTRAFTVVALPPEPHDVSSPAALEIDYLVEIHPRRAGTSPTASARLLALSGREILWAGILDNAGGLSDSATIAVASILRHVENREIRAMAGFPEASSAYRETLEGQRLLRDLNLPSIRRARKRFNAALSLVPDHVAALAGLARAHMMEWLVRAPCEQSYLEAAEEYAKRAISICPDDHRGFDELGFVNTYLKRLDVSVECLNRAMSLNPDDAGIAAHFASVLVYDGHPGQAIQRLEQSKHLYRPSDDDAQWVLAWARFDHGDYRASLDAIAQMSNPAQALRIAAAAHAILGEAEQARQISKMYLELNPGFDLTSWLSMLPYRSLECRQRYTEGLRLAGFK